MILFGKLQLDKMSYVCCFWIVLVAIDIKNTYKSDYKIILVMIAIMICIGIENDVKE